MKKITKSFVMSCVLTIAFSGAALAGSGPSVVDAFVGKKIASKSGTVFEYLADGTIGGLLRGETPIKGVYTADAEKVCTTYSAPEMLAGKERCSKLELNGKTIIFIRGDGSKSKPYTIQ